jgi:hypothetical protein
MLAHTVDVVCSVVNTTIRCGGRATDSSLTTSAADWTTRKGDRYEDSCRQRLQAGNPHCLFFRSTHGDSQRRPRRRESIHMKHGVG